MKTKKIMLGNQLACCQETYWIQEYRQIQRLTYCAIFESILTHSTDFFLQAYYEKCSWNQKVYLQMYAINMKESCEMKQIMQ
jgi:hypothetical protein